MILICQQFSSLNIRIASHSHIVVKLTNLSSLLTHQIYSIRIHFPSFVFICVLSEPSTYFKQLFSLTKCARPFIKLLCLREQKKNYSMQWCPCPLTIDHLFYIWKTFYRYVRCLCDSELGNIYSTNTKYFDCIKQKKRIQNHCLNYNAHRKTFQSYTVDNRRQISLAGD